MMPLRGKTAACIMRLCKMPMFENEKRMRLALKRFR